jgi:lysophospholipase
MECLSFESATFKPSHGAFEIFYKRSKPLADGPVHLIFIIHGIYDYHKSFIQFANDWSEFSNSNLAFVLLDLPGHGHSGGKRGHIASFEAFTSAIFEFITSKEVQDGYKISQKSIWGHDLGAAFALATYLKHEHILRNEIDDLILNNPLLFPSEIMLPKISTILSLGRKISGEFPLKRMRISTLLSDRPERRYEFEADALILDKITSGYVEECKNMAKYIRSRGYFIDKSVLFIISYPAPFFDSDLVELFFKGIGSKNKVLKKVEYGYHEVFNGPAKQKTLLFEILDNWQNK